MWDLVPQPVMGPGPLHWEHRALATEPPGKSLINLFSSPSHFVLDTTEISARVQTHPIPWIENSYSFGSKWELITTLQKVLKGKDVKK